MNVDSDDSSRMKIIIVLLQGGSNKDFKIWIEVWIFNSKLIGVYENGFLLSSASTFRSTAWSTSNPSTGTQSAPSPATLTPIHGMTPSMTVSSSCSSSMSTSLLCAISNANFEAIHNTNYVIVWLSINQTWMCNEWISWKELLLWNPWWSWYAIWFLVQLIKHYMLFVVV